MYYIAYKDAHGFNVAIKDKGRLFFYDNREDAEKGCSEITLRIENFLNARTYKTIPRLFGIINKTVEVPIDSKLYFKANRILGTMTIIHLPSTPIYNSEEISWT